MHCLNEILNLITNGFHVRNERGCMLSAACHACLKRLIRLTRGGDHWFRPRHHVACEVRTRWRIRKLLLPILSFSDTEIRTQTASVDRVVQRCDFGEGVILGHGGKQRGGGGGVGEFLGRKGVGGGNLVKKG